MDMAGPEDVPLEYVEPKPEISEEEKAAKLLVKCDPDGDLIVDMRPRQS